MYAAVVNWTIVWLIFLITIIHGLETKSMDFVLAITHAKLEKDNFVEFPFRFEYDLKGE